VLPCFLDGYRFLGFEPNWFRWAHPGTMLLYLASAPSAAAGLIRTDTRDIG
jgi:hypothetical protein